MKTHTWTQTRKDLGQLGIETVWTCDTCGAEAGPVYPDTPGVEEPPTRQPYYIVPTMIRRGYVSVSHDCDEAQIQIQAAKEEVQEQEDFRASMPPYLNPHSIEDRKTWKEMQAGSLGTRVTTD